MKTNKYVCSLKGNSTYSFIISHCSYSITVCYIIGIILLRQLSKLGSLCSNYNLSRCIIKQVTRMLESIAFDTVDTFK